MCDKHLGFYFVQEMLHCLLECLLINNKKQLKGVDALRANNYGICKFCNIGELIDG